MELIKSTDNSLKTSDVPYSLRDEVSQISRTFLILLAFKCVIIALIVINSVKIVYAHINYELSRAYTFISRNFYNRYL